MAEKKPASYIRSIGETSLIFEVKKQVTMRMLKKGCSYIKKESEYLEKNNIKLTPEELEGT